MSDAAGTPPIVVLKGITKSFPGVVANADVDLDVQAGEIHALLGENGAGKSTLMNILTGIYKADAGDIIIDGYAVQFASPVDAIAAGIGMVHQHFKLVQAFTVAENLHLGWADAPRRASAAHLEARTRGFAATFNLFVRAAARVDQLSAGEQQRVEILRVLVRQARVLILDEPTAVLTPAEARDLFKALRAFRARGNAVIFISHKLEEVLAISDRISVLRGGRKVATLPAAQCDARGLAKLMVGRDIVLADVRSRAKPAAAGAEKPPFAGAADRAAARPAVLGLRGVSARDDRGLPALRSIDLDLRAGEILGLAGVAGNGQRELSQVLTGLRRITGGQILVDGRRMTSGRAARFAARGIGHIPEDRLRSGLAPSASVADNAILREYKRWPVSFGPIFNPFGARRLARTIVSAAEVAVPSLGMPIGNLSGGNQQRLVARREMRIASKALIAAYPSRGLDVGAINTMLRYFVEMRDKGVAVLLISEELDELLEVSDRIAVLYEGRIMGLFDRAEADGETIGMLMGGQTVPTGGAGTGIAGPLGQAAYGGAKGAEAMGRPI